MNSKHYILTLVCALSLLLALSAPALAAAEPVLDNLSIAGFVGGDYLKTADFDADDYSYELELDPDEEELTLYVYYDEDKLDEVAVYYDRDEIIGGSYNNTHKRQNFVIKIDCDDLKELTIEITDTNNKDAEYSIDLNGDTTVREGSTELEGLYLNIGDEYDSRSSKRLGLYPAFDEKETDYAVLLPYDEDLEGEKLNLRFSLKDESTELSINSVAQDLDDEDHFDYVFSLPSAGNSTTVSFVVEKSSYKLTVYFAAANTADDAYLTDLVVRSKISTKASDELELTPDFDEDETSYSLSNVAAYKTLYLYPRADSGMKILVQGKLLSDDYYAFAPAELDKLTVTVEAADLQETTDYVIDLNKVNALEYIYLYAGSASKSVALSPTFAADKYNYVAQVGQDVASVYLATKAKDGATTQLSVNGGSYTTFTNYATLSLSSGLTTYDFLVGGNTHYYINVYRPAAETNIVVSSQYISINRGTARQIAAYNINGNNFVKLRDLGYLLNGTPRQFSVSYAQSTNAVTLFSGNAYTAVGGEMTVPSAFKKAIVSPQSVNLNGVSVYPMAYNIDGNNYILLRDLAALFNFAIEYSGSTATVYTDRGYGQTAASVIAPVVTVGDFSDIDMKLVGMDADGAEDTYVSKTNFKPDTDDYDVQLPDDIEKLELYVYYDDQQYELSVEYDGDADKVSAKSYKSADGSQRFVIEVDPDDLDDIDVTVTNSAKKDQDYCFKLDLE